MKRANVLGRALVFASTIATATPLAAQVEVGADAAVFSSYVWRGVSLTNKPVFEPAVYLSVPLGNASLTVGGWANIDLGKYDDAADDISLSGGLSAFNLAEFDPYAEISFPVGVKTTLTGGATAYIYPNDLDATSNGGLDSESNTVEVYGKAEFDVPLAPAISAYYDVDKVKGLYVEGSVGHSIALSENNSLDLGALAGFNEGQGESDDPSFNFADDGFTHLDLSAGVPLTAGAFSITPVIHFLINGDEGTKVTSPTNLDEDFKLWGGVTISWSNASEEPQEDAVETPGKAEEGKAEE